MATPIHVEIKALANANPAAYVSIDIIEQLTIARFLVAIQKITGAEIPAGQQVLSASLDSAAFATPPATSASLTKYANALPNQIGLTLNSDLTVIVKVFVKGDKTKLISTVTVVVSDLVIYGSYATNAISFEGTDFKVKTTVVRDINADQTLKNAGIDPLEAARVEGLISYSSVNSAIQANLAQRKDLSLSDIFPAFDFGATAQLVPLRSGQFLGIIPSAFTRVETAACKCADGPDLGTSASSNTITVPPNPKVPIPLGGVTIGGPLAENVDPLKDLGRRFIGSGQAGVYLPRAAYDGLTVQVMPAIAIAASDDGFIGFDARGTVAFTVSPPTLDAQKGGIIVSVNMDISVQATCTLDMGCGIRLPIGYAIINPAPGSKANLVMGFYPAVDKSGTVKLDAILQSVDMGKYVAVILGIGTALEILGVTAFVGFLIDVVLSAIVSNQLPGALTNAVKKYLGQNEWVLLKFGDLLKSTYSPVIDFEAPFDVDGDTILASVSYHKKLNE
jgi:hypothetical protein